MTIRFRSSRKPLASAARSAAGPATRDRLVPVLVAGGLVAAGVLLLRVDPGSAQVPDAAAFGEGRRRGRLRNAALAARDAVRPFAPSNLTDQVGRSLILGGVALLLTRLFDEIAGRGEP